MADPTGELEVLMNEGQPSKKIINITDSVQWLHHHDFVVPISVDSMVNLPTSWHDRYFFLYLG